MRLDSGLLLTVLWLCCSLRLHPDFYDFRRSLQQHLPLLDGPTLTTTGDETVDAALEVLRIEREREKAPEVKEEDRNGVGGDILWPSAANQDEDMVVDETDQPQTPVDEVDKALKILMRNATEEFGFIPRDAYKGVLNLPAAKNQHAIATMNLDFFKLMTTVKEFSERRGMSSTTSHHVIVVFPTKNAPTFDHWGIEFKSTRIAKRMGELMRLEEDRKLRMMCDLLRKVTEGSTFAGWIFETIVHRKFTGGWKDESRQQPIPMKSDGGDPPAFSVDLSLSSPTPGTSLSSFTPLRAHARTVVKVNLAGSLSDVTLDTDKYYTPTTANNPLFDSFTIDQDHDRRTVQISIFQITISPRHGGSADGYPLIRKIMTRVSKLLKGVRHKPKIKVTYFLVCPDSKSKYVWQMPVDWNKYTTVRNHRGEAFCIPVSLSESQQM